jgi:haloalkane dehalogenase
LDGGEEGALQRRPDLNGDRRSDVSGSDRPGAPASAPDVARTPDERFASLVGYPFEPHYVSVRADGVDPLRMHYVDSGPTDGPVVLLLHGQPTWSYLYRSVIPVLTARGPRAVAPDNIGFGRSDKPTERTLYTYQRHVQWMTSFVDELDLGDVTLVVQDWGGPIGLSTLAARPDRFARVVATNTVLHTSDPALEGRLTWANHGTGDGRVVLEEALVDYVSYCQRAPELLASTFVYSQSGTLDAEVLAAYDAPFPDQTFTAGLRQMTGLIPLTRNDPGARIGRATMHALATWDRPFLTAYSDGDPATRGWESVFQERVPGAAGRPHPTICGAAHFVPEEKGDELGRIVADFVAACAAQA